MYDVNFFTQFFPVIQRLQFFFFSILLLCICECICMHVCVCIYVLFACVWVHVVCCAYVCANACMYVHTSVCICVSMWIQVYVSTHEWMYTCLCVCIYTFKCLYVYLHVYEYMWMHVYVFGCFIWTSYLSLLVILSNSMSTTSCISALSHLSYRKISNTRTLTYNKEYFRDFLSCRSIKLHLLYTHTSLELTHGWQFWSINRHVIIRSRFSGTLNTCCLYY